MADEERAPIRQKIELEVELDTSEKVVLPNKYQNIIDLAKAVDSWRIFPRIFISMYIYLLYRSVIWFMELPDPNMNQAGLISVVVGAGAAWFGLYTGSSKKFEMPPMVTQAKPPAPPAK